MVSFAFTVFGVDWEFLKPYIVLGLALGSVYALSGVGVVVLYQATGVLNLAFGAIGAAGALIAYYLVNHTSFPHWVAYLACVVFGAAVNVLYGMLLGPAFAKRDPLVKMMGTLGLALILLGVMAWRARRRLRHGCCSCRRRAIASSSSARWSPGRRSSRSPSPSW